MDSSTYDIRAAPSLEQPVRTVAGKGKFDELYRRGGELGLGAFATVFLGTHRPSAAEYAIKKIDRAKMVWGNRDALTDEINNLAYVRDGPCIVQLYEVYEERKHCYLVMEWMRGGELFDRILEKKIFTEREARDCCRCILRGLHYMHEKRVAHRDLKPENLLLAADSDTAVKLADFGFARRVREQNGCRTLCGTPGYLAPEILERWPAYDVKCDLWSVGVILFLLLGGYLPFEDEDEDRVFERTRNGQYDFHPAYWKDVSADAKNLVTKLLTVNPNKRFDAAAALQFGWMTDGNLDSRGELHNMSTLKDNLRKGKDKLKAAVQAIKAANRINELNKNFHGYLERKQEDSTIFLQRTGDEKVTGPAPKVGSAGSAKTAGGGASQSLRHKFVEDSLTGRPFADFYEFGEVLGEGGYACVYRSTHCRTGEVYAVKDIDTGVLEASSKSALKDEIAALKMLRGGPHIIRLFDVFEERDHTYLVMEEMKGGDLLTRITDKEVYTEREARKTCKIIFQAMDYIHKKKIAHRDIKPENVLMVEADDDHSIKIADFGFAKRVPKPNCLRTLCGTAQYVAPEVLDLQSSGYDNRADMWSVGVVTYILLGGYAPFEGPVQELARAICKGDYCFHDKYWKEISDAAKSMISSLLQTDADERLSAEEALQCPWMIIEEESLMVKDLTGAQAEMKKREIQKQESAALAAAAAEDAASGEPDGGAGVAATEDELDAAAAAAAADGGTTKKKKKKKKLVEKKDSIDIDFVNGLGTVEEAMHRKAQRTELGAVDENATYVSGAEDMLPPTFDARYEWGALLEEGMFSVVHESKCLRTGEVFAVKRICRTFLDVGDAVAVHDEISALQHVSDCPWVVKLHEVFEEPDYTYMVLDRLTGGELIDRLIEKRHYTEPAARAVMKNVLSAVEHCHNRRIAIRNLKTENLILTSAESYTDVRVSDFGFAKRVAYPNSLQTQCGTEGYVAPEILEHRPQYDVQCDMWSVGVILYILLGGYRPFRGEEQDVMRQIRYGEYKFHKRYWRSISDDAKLLITRMLTVIPIGRITATAALHGPWMDGLHEPDAAAAADTDPLNDGKKKIKAAVQTIVATNKMQIMGENDQFTDF